MDDWKYGEKVFLTAWIPIVSYNQIMAYTAFKIRLGTRKLPKFLSREISIFSNRRRQIIAKAYILNNIHVNFSIDYCKKSLFSYPFWTNFHNYSYQ